MLNHRSLLVGLPLGTLVAPRVRAQQKPRVIGVLSTHNSQEDEAGHSAFVDKIFRGPNPGDLPIEQPTRVDLVINRKSAEALRLNIPRSLLVQAEKLIG